MTTPVLQRLLTALYHQIAALSWPALILLVGLHFSVSWLGFALAGEDKAAAVDTFWYFYFVTSTTIGYGDVTAATTAGRVVAVFWVMPGGIALFTAVIAKLVQSIGKVWTRRMRGDGDYSDMKDHLVILGWRADRTPRLIRMFLADRRYDHAGIVLVSRRLEQNPLPQHAAFVRVAALPSEDAIRRAGVAQAAAVIAMGESDAETLAFGLSVGALEPAPRIIAHFREEAMANLLRTHCPSAECSVSLSVEMLARAAQDPGSTEVQRQIISPIDSPTQFRVVVPAGAPTFAYGAALAFFKARHDATVIAVRRAAAAEIEVNAPSAVAIAGGDCIYFIAAERLRPEDVDWTAAAAAI